MEHGHAKGDVGTVRGAVIGRIVDDHVAGLEALAAFRENLLDASDVAGNRARLQRSALRRLAQLASPGVNQRCPEVFGLADDAGIGHSQQLVSHLDRDVVQGSLDHAGRYRVDPPVFVGFDGDVLTHLSRPTL